LAIVSQSIGGGIVNNHCKATPPSPVQTTSRLIQTRCQPQKNWRLRSHCSRTFSRLNHSPRGKSIRASIPWRDLAFAEPERLLLDRESLVAVRIRFSRRLRIRGAAGMLDWSNSFFTIATELSLLLQTSNRTSSPRSPTPHEGERLLASARSWASSIDLKIKYWPTPI
jgi:hypothetical protein